MKSWIAGLYLITLFCSLPCSAAMNLYKEAIPNPLQTYDENVIFHCYWKGTLDEKHLISIKSCYHFNVLQKKIEKLSFG